MVAGQLEHYLCQFCQYSFPVDGRLEAVVGHNGHVSRAVPLSHMSCAEQLITSSKRSRLMSNVEICRRVPSRMRIASAVYTMRQNTLGKHLLHGFGYIIK